MKTTNKYYNIEDDLKLYPVAWCYIVLSARGPGKTYSTLKYMIDTNSTFLFLKRTIEDVNLICKRASDSTQSDSDISPFVPINRDQGTNIKPFKISKGFGAFYNTEVENDKIVPVGDILGWIAAASMTEDIKGFNMLPDFYIFDEFAPKPWERIRHTEGQALLDLYETLSRDRVKRGNPELKFIALGNTVNINAPLLTALGLVDDIVSMQLHNEEYKYIDGIMIHVLPPADNIIKGELTGIQKRMLNTKYGKMAYLGEFGYNDFTCVNKQSLKGYRCIFSFTRENLTYYVYKKDRMYYVCDSFQKVNLSYNLDIEIECNEFYLTRCFELKNATIEGRVNYQSFSAYDLIMNFKKYYSI